MRDNVRANGLGQGLIATGQGMMTQALRSGFSMGPIRGWVRPRPTSGLCARARRPFVWGRVAIKFAQGELGLATDILSLGVALFILEYVLRLWLGRCLDNIHPLITLAGVVLGFTLFGAVGLVLGPLLLFYLLVLFQVRWSGKSGQNRLLLFPSS